MQRSESKPQEALKAQKGDEMIRKMLSLAAVGVVSVGLYGQADKTREDAKASGEKQTITGCLTEDQGAFHLATQAGDQMDVSGSADLSKHKNHTVKLTGTSSDEGGKKSLNVTKIEHVSPSCSK